VDIDQNRLRKWGANIAWHELHVTYRPSSHQNLVLIFRGWYIGGTSDRGMINMSIWLGLVIVGETTQPVMSLDWTRFPSLALVGALGGIVMLLMQMYELRSKMLTPKYRNMIRSPLFWLIYGGYLFAAALLAFFIHYDTGFSNGPLRVFATGLAAPAVLRQTVAAAAGQTVTLGREVSPDEQFRWSDLF
jgi:hypothetical protein